jgi:F420-0:gamma-glutamyl ligase
MGKATGVPVAVVRGLDPGVLTDEPASVRSDLVRPPADDLFR